jgi:hypothetical protein
MVLKHIMEKIESESVDWIHLSEDRAQWWVM